MTGALVSVPAGDGRQRVICFHHAGGGASVYANWARLLPELQVCPVQLPGRERRAAEPRHTEYQPLVAELAGELAEVVQPGTVFYGHSMGSLLAFGVAGTLQAMGAPVPAALVLAAYPAPHRPAPLAHVQLRADDAAGLISLLGAIGGLPLALLDHPEWLQAFLPTVRDDIRLCRSYHHQPAPPLACDIHAIAALDDQLVGADEVAEWRRHTAETFRLHTVAGGHLFVKDSAPEVTAIVRDVARGCWAADAVRLAA